MKRKILDTLVEWAKSPTRKPIVIRGARQVGKTYIVKKLSEEVDCFTTFIEINFELEPKYKDCFDSLLPQDIVDSISFLSDKIITPGNTLLFLDEIQVCPKAIVALRYFKEKMPNLHVIAAGSLLEFVLHTDQISMPVGRVEYLYMYPCSFVECMENSLSVDMMPKIRSITLDNPISDVMHKKFLQIFKQYMIIGGMPECVSSYLHDKDLYKVQRVQNAILQTYRDDFGKYASQSKFEYLQKIFDRAPGMVGTQIMYSKIDPDARSRDLKQAMQLLEQAGLIKKVISTSGSGLPLISVANDKKFKLQFLDVGLVQRASGLGVELLLEQSFNKINDGSLAEQVVGQLLLAYQDPFMAADLFFWSRDKKNSNAEVDFVMNFNGKIIPIEVKSGSSGRLKSLNIFLQERDLPLGVKISSAPLSMDERNGKRILNVPFYMISELGRLI